MSIKHSEGLKQEAARIALTSGSPRALVASDLDVGKATLGEWASNYRPTDMVSAPSADLAHENERLRLENRVLKEERGILKRLSSSSRASGLEVRVRAQLASHVASRDVMPHDAAVDAGLSILMFAADGIAGAR
jgi:transposase